MFELHKNYKIEIKDLNVEKAFWNVSQVSCYLHVKPSTIYAWAKVGEIPHFKIGKMLRFKKAEIDDWMESHRENGVERKKKALGALKAVGIPRTKIDRIVRNSIDGLKKLKYNPGLGNQVKSGTQKKGGDHVFV